MLEIIERGQSNVAPSKGFLCLKRRMIIFEINERKIITNKPDNDLPSNKISTAKQNVLTFLPLNLYEQFSKIPNIYFFLIGILQMIKSISPTHGLPLIYLPLALVVFVSAIKDLFEDIKRCRSDTYENTKRTLVLKENAIKIAQWQELFVGDIVKVCENEFFPLDLLLLKSSDPDGIFIRISSTFIGKCQIETKNLDGETNLKMKKIPKEILFLHEKTDSQANFGLLFKKFNRYAQFNIQQPLKCQIPSFKTSMVKIKTVNNPYLGAYQINENSKFSLDSNNFVLRGCSLRNTKFIYGLALYSGHETKLMLNSIKTRLKFSKVDGTMSKQVMIIFLFQIGICILSALYATIWFENWRDTMEQLEFENEASITNFFLLVFITKFGNWLLLFTQKRNLYNFRNLVPISLLVTLEVVKFLQGVIIGRDKKMIAQSTNINVVVQSSSLNEELGQIQQIFSDKTGTLTQNQMEFKKVSINGFSQGCSFSIMTWTGERRNLPENELKKLLLVTNVDFKDEIFFSELFNPKAKNQEQLRQFLRITDFEREALLMISVCHTVIAEEKDGEINYNVKL